MREAYLQSAISAAVAAGNVLTDRYTDVLHIARKESLRDVVTDVDRLAEDAALSILKKNHPEIPVLSEEQGFTGATREKVTDAYWVVDALDGTVNYVNHIPFFCVSIALIEKKEPTVGVIYNPLFQDLYYGANGVGAFKNQGKLKVKEKSVEESVFSVAFSGKKTDPMGRNDEFLLMGEINDLSRGCLRTGSAAMNLAYLAEGRLGGCWGKGNKRWDVAAGLLLARLAGAEVHSRIVDEEKNLITYFAGAPNIWAPLKSRLIRVLGDL